MRQYLFVLLSMSFLLTFNQGFGLFLKRGNIVRNGVALLSEAPSSKSANSRNSFSSTALNDKKDTSSNNNYDGIMPITVLSGFLGAGKTSFLTHAVNNNNNSKYGLVVNDMANVNVDSKLIKKQTSSNAFDGIDTMELSNGCVCCTLAEDMMASVARLVELSNTKQVPYDHIIVECSGIAEPRNIRELFQEAEDYGMPLLRKIKLDTLVTVVDATVFMEYFGKEDNFNIAEKLIFRSDDDIPNKDTYGNRKVTELLLEQVECADVVLINKIDLLDDVERSLPLLEKVIKSINPTARVEICQRGAISPETVLGVAKGNGAADWGILDEHRKMVQAVKAKSCTDPTCTDPTHNHEYNHDHSHSHSSHTSEESCTDSTCTDPTHNHDHSHSHSSHENEEQTTARTRFGITSFVYSRRRPFHPERMSTFLQSLGKFSIEGLNDVNGQVLSTSSSSSKEIKSAAKSLLRSKGFVWIATSKTAAYFLSHAGQYLEVVILGRWWADIPESEWPVNSQDDIRVDWDMEHPKHGDRRQELVFIGQFDSEEERKGLENLLDECLLTDDEMEIYEKVACSDNANDEALRNAFFPPN